MEPKSPCFSLLFCCEGTFSCTYTFSLHRLFFFYLILHKKLINKPQYISFKRTLCMFTSLLRDGVNYFSYLFFSVNGFGIMLSVILFFLTIKADGLQDTKLAY